MLKFVKAYVWHLSNDRWEKAMDKYEMVSKTFRQAHQRFLNNRSTMARKPNTKSHKKVD